MLEYGAIPDNPDVPWGPEDNPLHGNTRSRWHLRRLTWLRLPAWLPTPRLPSVKLESLRPGRGFMTFISIVAFVALSVFAGRLSVRWFPGSPNYVPAHRVISPSQVTQFAPQYQGYAPQSGSQQQLSVQQYVPAQQPVTVPQGPVHEGSAYSSVTRGYTLATRGGLQSPEEYAPDIGQEVYRQSIEQGYVPAPEQAVSQHSRIMPPVGLLNPGLVSRQFFDADECPPCPQPDNICEKKKNKSVFVYGKCPEVCAPFSPSSYSQCAGLVQFGCEMQSCGGANYKCTLNLQKVKEGSTVCPGDKVVFDGIDINKFQEITYQIDLRAPPKMTDMYILSDATGSMGGAIGTAKAKAKDLLNVFGIRKGVAFGVGMYRDESELSGGFQNLASITENKGTVTGAINSLKASGGGDRDEANLIALYKVATESSVGWRPGSRKFVVYFGDWPGHEPSCAISGVRVTREVVIEKMKAKGITVIAVNFQKLDAAPSQYKCGGGAKAPTGQATAITTMTMGVQVHSSDQKQLIDKIRIALGALTQTFDVDSRSCDSSITSVHNPALPLTLLPLESATVTNTIKIKKNICEVKGKFECQYKYFEGAAALEDTPLEIVNVKGC